MAETTPFPIEQLAAPEPVRAALARLRDELVREAGPNLVALLLYGGLAAGRFTPGESDVNVALVLKDASAASLLAVGGPLRRAYRAAQVVPFLLQEGELQQAADVFPTKLLELQARHKLLAGSDPFGGLRVQPEHVRLHVEQSLRNLALRLRRRLVADADDPGALATVLRGMLTPFRVQLAALLGLQGAAAPEGLAESYAEAARRLDLDGEALARCAALAAPEAALPAAPEVSALYARFLDCVLRATAAADALEGRL